MTYKACISLSLLLLEACCNAILRSRSKDCIINKIHKFFGPFLGMSFNTIQNSNIVRRTKMKSYL